MSAAKHTPGEWIAKREGWSTVYVEARIRPGVLQEVAACGPTEAGHEQQEANARLIAAAPELLAFVVGYLEDYKSEDGMYDHKHYAKRAAELIAKATGSAS